LEKTIKLREANELGILAAKNQSDSKIELARSNLQKEEEEFLSLQQ